MNQYYTTPKLYTLYGMLYFLGSWCCGGVDQIQEDGRPSHAPSWTPRDRKGRAHI